MTDFRGFPEPTSDVLSDDKVLIDNAGVLIARRNSSWTRDQVLAALMLSYWAGQLALFTLHPSEGCEDDGKGNFRRLPAGDKPNSAPMSMFEVHQGRVVADCLRLDWPREKFLQFLYRAGVDRGVQPDPAGFMAVARMELRQVYGPDLEYLAGKRADVTALVAWCERHELALPPEWHRDQGTAAETPPIEPTASESIHPPDQLPVVRKYVRYRLQDAPLVDRVLRVAAEKGISLHAAVGLLELSEIPGGNSEKSRRSRIYEQARKRNRG